MVLISGDQFNHVVFADEFVLFDNLTLQRIKGRRVLLYASP